MAKKYKVSLTGPVGDRKEMELYKDQIWMVSLSEYRKITRISPKGNGTGLTISYKSTTDNIETDGKNSLEEFVMWALENNAECLVVTFQSE